MDKWNGITERRANPDDHDKLTRLLVAVENHVSNFDTHVKEDKESFKDVRDQVGKHAKWIYVGLGVIGTLEFLLKH